MADLSVWRHADFENITVKRQQLAWGWLGSRTVLWLERLISPLIPLARAYCVRIGLRWGKCCQHRINNIRYIISSLVQVMAWCLFNVKPLTKTIISMCQDCAFKVPHNFLVVIFAQCVSVGITVIVLPGSEEWGPLYWHVCDIDLPTPVTEIINGNDQ